MQRISNETRKKVVREHIQGGRTLASLAAEYGVSTATVSNWVRAYREECQINDDEKSQLELMEEVLKLCQEKSELQKENDFLKKQRIFAIIYSQISSLRIFLYLMILLHSLGLYIFPTRFI